MKEENLSNCVCYSIDTTKDRCPERLSSFKPSTEIELNSKSYQTAVVLLKGTQVLSNVDLGFTVSACAIAADENEAIVGGQDGKLHIYSVNGDTLTQEAVLEEHRPPITVIRYSPDVSMFASADANREAVVWDRLSREVIRNCNCNMLLQIVGIGIGTRMEFDSIPFWSCGYDCSTAIKCVYSIRPPLPAVAGYEGVGEVHLIGSEVKGL
ncbi:hypothetical protein L1887_41862 [Cichorium endivia]|nr:hypothetical protein L1887_41862 [Cichorium endivia]